MSKGIRDGERALSVRVRTARKRTVSSSHWLARQLNDPYVARARRDGYRSRSAYKLLEIDRRFGVLRPDAAVVDLGCAPGGWCQVALARRCTPVVGVDLNPVKPVPGATLLQGDIREEGVATAVTAACGAACCVLADMAEPATGHRPTDRLRVSALAEVAAEFAESILAPGGTFVVKVLAAGAQDTLLSALRGHYRTVRHFKPEASRKESDEIYLVALDWRGGR